MGRADHTDAERADDETRWSDWMARANAGDGEVYARLLDEIGGVMERYLTRHFGGGDFVEDCVQECLLSIHRARATYDPRRPFRAWMFAIVRHKAIDTLRRRGTRGRHESAEGNREPAAPTPHPATALEAAQALRGLAPEYSSALLMTKLEGRSLDEAAREAGVSVSAMKSRVHRAIKQVRHLLAQEED